MTTVAVLPGDGIGPEVTREALKVLDALNGSEALGIETFELPLGAAHLLETGEVLPDDAQALLRSSDAVLLGAMGDPRVAPGVLERGVIVAIRTMFRQSVNVRPIRLLPGVTSPLRDLTPERCDFVIVRENTEGLYTGGGSTTADGTDNAVAVHTSVTTAAGTASCVRYAFGLAQRRKRHLTLCHKTNILVDAGRLWSSTVDELSQEFSDVTVDYAHVDAMCLHLVNRPQHYDVIVTDNLFGDILSDLGAAIQGGLGTAASANLNLDGTGPSLFEPVHGSAPDIAGRGIANPAAAILSVAMMLDEFGHAASAARCRKAVDDVTAEVGSRGVAISTAAFGDRVVAALT